MGVAGRLTGYMSAWVGCCKAWLVSSVEARGNSSWVVYASRSLLGTLQVGSAVGTRLLVPCTCTVGYQGIERRRL